MRAINGSQIQYFVIFDPFSIDENCYNYDTRFVCVNGLDFLASAAIALQSNWRRKWDELEAKMGELRTKAGFVSRMDEDWLLVDINEDTKIATITLNRPEAENSLTYAAFQRLTEIYEELGADDRVKVIIIKANGRSFSSGGDVSELGLTHGHTSGQKGERRPSQRQKLMVDAWLLGPNGLFARILDCQKATIAQVHGYCYGGGLNISNVCDITVAADNSLFAHPGYRYIGPTTDVWLMVQTVGIKKAKEMMLTVRPIDAQEALAAGLINKVVPLEELEEATMEMALRIAQLPIDAIVMGKVQFHAALQAMGQGSGYTAGYVLHSLQSGIRYEEGEFNMLKARRDSGPRAAIDSRQGFYAEGSPIAKKDKSS